MRRKYFPSSYGLKSRAEIVIDGSLLFYSSKFNLLAYGPDP